MTITVTGTNDAPEAVADSATTAEKSLLTVTADSGVLKNDNDPDNGDMHSVSAVDGVEGNVATPVDGDHGGTFTVAADGSYTFDPGSAFDYLAAGESQTTSVIYTNTDNNGASSSETLTVTVTGENNAPVAVADSATTPQNDILAVDSASGVLSNDTDPDYSNTHYVSAVNTDASNVGMAVSGTNGGTFMVEADGSYVFDPGTAFDFLAEGQSLTTSVTTYTNSDNNGLTSTATLTVTVTGVNDAPVAVVDSGTTAENVILMVPAGSGVLSNDTDPDHGGTHRVSAVNGDVAKVAIAVAGDNGGTFTVAADGSYVFDPGSAFDYLAVDESQTTSVTYTNTDDNGLSSSETLMVTVTGVNDAPVVDAPHTLNVIEGSGTQSHDLTLSLHDVDSTDQLHVTGDVTYTVSGDTAGHEAAYFASGVSVSADALSVDTNNANYTYLTKTESVDLVAHYKVTDGYSTVDQTETIHLAGQTYSLTEQVNYWSTSAPLSGVTVFLIGANGNSDIELRNVGFVQNGSTTTATYEIWTGSATTNIEALQLDLALQSSAHTTWSAATALSGNWGSVVNNTDSALSVLAYNVSGAALSGATKLGTLTTQYATSADGTIQLSYGELVATDATSHIIDNFAVTPQHAVTNASGSVTFSGLELGSYSLSAAETSASIGTNTVSIADLVAAMNIVAGAVSSSGSQLFALDVNASGVVDNADKTAIGNLASHVTTPTWLFVDSTASAGTIGAVNWSAQVVQVDLQSDTNLQLIGVVSGDVNGSFHA